MAVGSTTASPLDRLARAERVIRAYIGHETDAAVWNTMMLQTASLCPEERAEVFETIANLLRRTGPLADRGAYLAVARQLVDAHTPASRAVLSRTLASWLPRPEDGELVRKAVATWVAAVAHALLEVPPAELADLVAAAAPLRLEENLPRILRHLLAQRTTAERQKLAGALAIGTASPARSSSAEPGSTSADPAESAHPAPPARVAAGWAAAAELAPPRPEGPRPKRPRRAVTPAGAGASRPSRRAIIASPTRATSTSAGTRANPPHLDPAGLDARQAAGTMRPQPEAGRADRRAAGARTSPAPFRGQMFAERSPGLHARLVAAAAANDSVAALAACRLFAEHDSWPTRINSVMCAHLARSRDATLATAFCALFPRGFWPSSPRQGHFMAHLLVEAGTYHALEAADAIAMRMEDCARTLPAATSWRLPPSWYSRLRAAWERLPATCGASTARTAADRFLAPPAPTGTCEQAQTGKPPGGGELAEADLWRRGQWEVEA